MNRPLLFLIITFMLALTSCEKYTLITTQHTQLHREDLKGKWVIFNYWASWCPSCLKEIPALNQLTKQYPHQVLILGVNTDHLLPNEQQQIANRYHINYPLLITDPAPIWHLPDRVDVLPTTFIISPQDKLTYTLQGSQTTEKLEGLLGLNKEKTL